MATRVDTAPIGRLINEFLRATRAAHRDRAQPLPPLLLTRYAGVLKGQNALLGRVRVAFVRRLPDPDALNQALQGLEIAPLSFSGDYEAMTFVDTILLSTDVLDVAGFDDIVRQERKRADATLLHELVHVVQYAALGVDPTNADSIGLFTRYQVPDYLRYLGVEPPAITYDKITFEDAARETEGKYKAGEPDLDGVAIAYRWMTDKNIPFTRL